MTAAPYIFSFRVLQGFGFFPDGDEANIAQDFERLACPVLQRFCFTLFFREDFLPVSEGTAVFFRGLREMDIVADPGVDDEGTFVLPYFSALTFRPAASPAAITVISPRV